MGGEYYPEDLLPMVQDRQRLSDDEPAELYRRFSEVREQVLLGYGYNTARAYWGDLEDVALWALARGKDPLTLTDKDVKQYIALMRRRGYAESTVRRRVTPLRRLRAAAEADVPM